MHWQFTPYVLPLAVGALVSVGVAVYAWRRRRLPGGAALAALMLGVAEWSLAYALLLVSQDLSTKILWSKTQWIGIVFVPLAWCTFALQYAGRQRLVTRSTLLSLSIVPLVTLALMWSNELHGAISTRVELDPTGLSPALDVEFGAWFWVHTAYSYALLLAGTAMVTRELFRRRHVYRLQAAALLVGVLAPWLGNGLYLSGLMRWAGVDLTPVFFTVTGLSLAWGVLRFRLLDVAPVARDAVFENMADGVIVIDATNRVVDANPAAERIIGRPAASMVGQPVAETLAGRSSLLARDVSRLEANGEITLDSDSGRRHYDLKMSPIYGRDARVMGGLVVLRDTTERKRMEEALSAARDQAMEASRLKSEFLATMSHEIRTPMNAVIGMTELLLDGDLPPRERGYAETMRHSSETLLSIINDILDFSKIEAGRLELELIELDPRELVRGVEQLFAQEGRQKGLQLSASVDEQVPESVRGDSLRLRQVLVNLVGNAIKFTERGHVRIVMAAIDRGPNEWTLRVEVEDTGIGIPSDAQRRLFEPFTQADGSTTRRYGGTGLGLAISKRIVERMDGEIGVRSEPGTGSTFWFTVRVAKATGEATPRGRPDDRAAPPSRSAMVGGGPLRPRVLVVEDSATNRLVALAMLERLGCHADTAEHGGQALEMIARDVYDAVLMDCYMPGMDGFDATRAIRRLESDARRTPILALTANVTRGDRERCLAAGMDDYLPKPIRLRDLSDALQKWVPRHAEAAASLAGKPTQRAGSDPAVGPRAIDQAALASLRELEAPGQEDAFKQVVELFLHEIPGNLARLRSAAETANGDALVKAAHSLKGSAGFLGARSLASLCLEAERRGREGPLSGADDLVAEIQAAAEAAAAELRAVLVETPAAEAALGRRQPPTAATLG